jgi:hypothetical protein
MRTQVRDWKPGYVCAWRVRNSPRETSFRVSDKQFVAQEANARRDIQRCCLLQRSSAIYQRSSAVISGYQRRARSYHLTAPSGRRCSEVWRCREVIGASTIRPRSWGHKNSHGHRLTSTALPLKQTPLAAPRACVTPPVRRRRGKVAEGAAAVCRRQHPR